MREAFKQLRKKIWEWILGLSTIDEKIVYSIKETKRRAELVKNEACDVVKAVKEVGKQLKDIPGAFGGKARKGRKPNNKKEIKT